MTDDLMWRVGQAHAPAYVYDLDQVRQAHRALRNALPAPSVLLYSLKANPHPAIVQTLATLGCGAEVSSAGELAAALNAGVAPDSIQYTGPGKSDAEVAEAVKAGVCWFSVDSPTGLRQVTAATAAAGLRATVLLRLNGTAAVPRQGLAMAGVPSPFGADAAWVSARPADFAGVNGFHLYFGTNLPDEGALLAQFQAALAIAKMTAAALRLRPRVLNLGGGFGAPFACPGPLPELPTLATKLAVQLDETWPGWRTGHPRVVFESGRYLTGTAGAFFTRVADVKESQGRPIIVLESGINHLGGLSGLRRLPPIVPELQALRDSAPTLRQAIVAGPLCTPLDTWAPSVDAPAVRPGDLLRVPNVGAYGLSASLLAFLGHPLPREVVLAGGRVLDVSRLSLIRLPIPTAEGS